MAGAIAAAVIGASLSLNGVLRGWAWLSPVIITVGVVALAMAVLRALRAPAALVTLGGFAALVFILCNTFLRKESIAGFIPGPDTLKQAFVLFDRAGETVYAETAPVAPNTGIVLLICLCLGLVVLLMDTLAVPLALPATSGLGLLAVLVVPATIKPQGAGLAGFLAASAGFILLLGCAQWFAPDARLQSGTGRGQGQLRRSVVLGGAALAVGLVLPLAVPGFDQGTFPVGSRLNPWGPSNGLNPMITLGNSLRTPTGDGRITYATSSSTPVYLRSVTIDRFEGESWAPDDRASSRRLGTGQIVPGYTLPEELVRDLTIIDTGQFTSPYLPVPYTPAAVNGLNGRWSWDPLTLSIRGEDRTSRNQHYTVVSVSPRITAAALTQAGTASPADGELSEEFTQVPGNVPEIVRNTAGTLTTGLRNNFAKALAIQRYLRSAEFTYSLQAPVQGGYDGNGLSVLADFLQQKSGYCVHFASAMAVMARVTGIPSRIAVGYAPGHPTGNNIAVGGRDPLTEFSVDARDAHAWPELYFEGLGWVPFEPTPSRGSVPDYAADAVTPGGSGSNLDEDDIPVPNQTPLPSSSAVAPAPLPGTGTGAGTGIPQAVFVLAGALLAAALLASPRLLRAGIRARRLREVRPPGQAGPAVPPALAWDELQDLARDYGHVPRPSETPRHFAAGLQGSIPSALADDAGMRAVHALTADFERHRYGRPADGGAPGAGARLTADRLSAVRAMLRRGRSWLVRLRADWFPPSLLSRWFRTISAPFRWAGRGAVRAGAFIGNLRKAVRPLRRGN
ncbi:transglutaminase TgpA family protein [Arthrobacter cupressi]|uniref:Transglutaminase-like domain-containing protein n=1 Tax=Arthrobacter cupressi TaxID=1045773 RepID=A0A1G8IVK8_9MICC|nr:DUF3488 and transglutaminase-like domain-containing protein [Arthrobacter cupressi]NYD79141.1 transglutaminase-like putative cysteine protease [Arthrobacter cupressi]SDI22896.1 protein of unknown function [Arthrobacter cupressi]